MVLLKVDYRRFVGMEDRSTNKKMLEEKKKISELFPAYSRDFFMDTREETDKTNPTCYPH